MVCILQQRTEIIIIYWKCRRCTRKTVTLFIERYPNSNLNHKYVLELVAKFSGTGSVAGTKSNNWRVFTAEPFRSFRIVVHQVGMSHETLKLNSFLSQ